MMKFARGHSVLRSIALAGGSLSILSFVGADSNDSDAQCVPGWEWSYNSLGQNPCEITALLDQACLGYTTLTVNPLPPGGNYPVPQANDAGVKQCCCNTVIYSLTDACTLCQFNTSVPGLTWQAWEQFCDSVNVTQYPWPIPQNVAIPHWAYLNATNPGFNATLAQAVGRDPEVTQPSPTPSTFPVTSPTSTSSSSSNPSQFTPGNSTSLNPPSTVVTSGGGSSKTSVGTNTGGSKTSVGTVAGGSKTDLGAIAGGSKTKVGAIAGGTVGGVVALVAIVILVLFFFKRRGARNSDGIPESGKTAYDSANDKHPHEPPKLYNPADPSTFPSPPPDGGSLGSDEDSTSPFQVGRYNGNAELQSVSTYLRDA